MIAPHVDVEVLEQMITNTGESLLHYASKQPVLLIFLRPLGCTFCREALADISARRSNIEGSGLMIIFVHMADHQTAERYFERYNLGGITNISDPECRYYAAFGLVKGTFTQLFGLHSWIRGFNIGFVQGHGVGSMIGDGFQMPGVFIVQDGEIKEAFIHKLVSDRPDYEQLVRNCCET